MELDIRELSAQMANWQAYLSVAQFLAQLGLQTGSQHYLSWVGDFPVALYI